MCLSGYAILPEFNFFTIVTTIPITVTRQMSNSAEVRFQRIFSHHIVNRKINLLVFQLSRLWVPVKTRQNPIEILGMIGP
jgi:hypothetical protein